MNLGQGVAWPATEIDSILSARFVAIPATRSACLLRNSRPPGGTGRNHQDLRGAGAVSDAWRPVADAVAGRSRLRGELLHASDVSLRKRSRFIA